MTNQALPPDIIRCRHDAPEDMKKNIPFDRNKVLSMDVDHYEKDYSNVIIYFIDFNFDLDGDQRIRWNFEDKNERDSVLKNISREV